MLPDRLDDDMPRRALERRNRPAQVVPVYAVPELHEAPAESVPLSEFTRALRRGKFILAAAIVLGLLGGLLATVLRTPIYRARTSLQLEGFNDNHFLRDVSPISPELGNASAENYLQNQVKLLQSETLARRVADKLGIQPPPSRPGLLSRITAMATGAQPLDPSTAAGLRRVKSVQRALSVRTSLQSQVMEVFYDAKDPMTAARAANTAANEFIALNRDVRLQLAQDTTEWLSGQAAELKQRLEAANRRLQEYARSSGLIYSGDHSVSEDRLRQLQQELANAEADRATKEARYKATSSGNSELPDALVTGPLRQYQIDLQALRKQRADLRSMFTPAHYKVKQVEAQIAELESAIAKERKDTLSRLRTEYDAAVGRERLLREANDRQMRTVQSDTEKGTQYNLLKREADTTQQLYDSMLQKMKEASVASALRATNVRVIDPATPPSSPYSPSLPLNLAIGFAAGALGGLGIVFARERSDKVRQPGDASLLNVPELGVIPSARDDRGLAGRGLIRGPHSSEVDLVTFHQESSMLSESFRATLASILFSSELNTPRNSRLGGRVLVVTSSEPGDGKTTVLTNLGIALAETQRRVLLIDADLRRPRLHQVFNVTNDWGLTDLLGTPDGLDHAPADALARPTHVPNLFLLSSGPGGGRISSLLYSSNLNRLLRRVRADFDLVLIDTAPLTLYSDSRVLGRMSDGVVLVVRANRTNRDDLRSAYERLTQDQIPVLGTILNDWRVDSGQNRTYGNYYRYYRRAGQDA